MMYYQNSSLKINPILNSRAIMTKLVNKYQTAADNLLKINSQNQMPLSEDEVLMLIKTPSYRLLLEKSYSKMIGASVRIDGFFENLYKIGINRNSLLDNSNNTYNLIEPAPYITSILDPELNHTYGCHNPAIVLLDIYRSFEVFSTISKKWTLVKPSDADELMLMNIIKYYTKISPEIIEDFAFNIRYVALVNHSKYEDDNTIKIKSVNFSYQDLPGVIFLGGSLLREEPKLAENMYHEVLHVKWMNTLNAYNIVKFEQLKNTEGFICPWARTGVENKWPFLRAVAAYHVYCHLLAYHKYIISVNGQYADWSLGRIPTIESKLEILDKYIQKCKSYPVLTELGIQYVDLIKEISKM